jgi:hypothetical protein
VKIQQYEASKFRKDVMARNPTFLIDAPEVIYLPHGSLCYQVLEHEVQEGEQSWAMLESWNYLKVLTKSSMRKNVLSRRKHLPKTRQTSRRRKLVSHMARKFLQMWLRLPLILMVNGQQAQLTLTQKKKGKNQERERKDFNG